MINFKVGDILESDADALVNTVNCEGYMGKGIAYQFKLRYPINNQEYIDSCRSGQFKIGTVLAIHEEDKVIINFPTKDKWRKKSEYHYIEKGLDALVETLPKLNIKSIAIPPLGCGNGRLEWIKVKEILIEKLNPIQDYLEITLYKPSHYYTSNTVKKPPKINFSHLVLMKIKIGLTYKNKTRLQKTSFMLNYYLKENYFKFDKYNYGPYAHSIDVISKQINEYQNYYNLNTESAIDMVENTLISSSIEAKKQNFDIPLRNALEFTNSISNSNTLELYTSLLFLITKQEPINKSSLINSFLNWSTYKKEKFSKKDIVEGIEELETRSLISKDLYGNYTSVVETNKTPL